MSESVNLVDMITTGLEIDRHDLQEMRTDIENIISRMSRGEKSRGRSLAKTKLEEAAMWLREELDKVEALISA